ncbi:MAG: diaminopimelate epimerase [Candidatus Omnitrophica bacterium]|nr:diaminopimelate epimerase [Candidatus Omnitrophota bacterium]
MKKTVRFVKTVGTGNDFILVDLRRQRLSAPPKHLAQKWCRRSRSIGADGILTVEPSKKAAVKMRVINPDGSEADMCGNGARCAAFYVASRNKTKRLTLETGAGIIQAYVPSKRRVRVTLTQPSEIRTVPLTALMKHFTAYHVTTGVPHAVIAVPNIREMDVARMGPAIRFHRAFRPRGANVDFIQVLNPHALRVRTYERGVESETLACGTGAVAAALVASRLGWVKSPVAVYPTSGERLVIRFDAANGTWKNVSLEGEVREVFEGEILNEKA